MSLLNIPSCSSQSGNTGVPSCFFDPGKINGVILMKKTKYFTPANMADDATFLAALQAATLATGDSRIYPVFRFQAVDDQSEDVVKSTTGYGEVDYTREGSYNWVFEMASGGLCLQANLRKFNFQSGAWSALLVYDGNHIAGWKDSSGNLRGYDLSIFHAEKMKINNGSDNAKYRVHVSISRVDQVNDLFGIYAAQDFNVESDVMGLINLELYEAAAPAAGTATVGVRTACGKANVYDDLSTALADKTLWKVLGPTGSVVSISDVVVNSTLKAFTVTFTGTGAHTINLESPATLAAASVGGAPINGYEGLALVQTMPAP